jgi:hypothetical protein
MKLAYGSVPVKALNINYFEQDTNDCNMIASDLQAGKTAVARGRKIIGTGKAFNFAIYGSTPSNNIIPIPDTINTVVLTSVECPINMNYIIADMATLDFSTAQTVANVIVDGTTYPVTVQYANNILTISCDTTIYLEYFFGKDDYR